MRHWLYDLWWLLRFGVWEYLSAPRQLREALQLCLVSSGYWSRKERQEFNDRLPSDGEHCWVLQAWFDKNGSACGYMGPDHLGEKE